MHFMLFAENVLWLKLSSRIYFCLLRDLFLEITEKSFGSMLARLLDMSQYYGADGMLTFSF